MGVLSSPTVLIMVQYQRTINISVAAAQTPGQSASAFVTADRSKTNWCSYWFSQRDVCWTLQGQHATYSLTKQQKYFKDKVGGEKKTFNCKSSFLWSEAPWNLSLNLRFMSFNTSDMNERHFRSSGGAEGRQQRSRDWANVCSPSDIILARWQMSMMLLIKAALMYRFLISSSTSTSGVLCCTCICPLDGPREHF